MASRILYLDYTNNIGAGGGQQSLALMLRHLPRDRFQPLLACPPDEKLIRLLGEGVPVSALPLDRSFRSLSRRGTSPLTAVTALARSWPALRRLREIVRREEPDLVHANNLKMFLLAAAATRKPVIWHVRDFFPGRLLPWLRAAARAASAVVCVSRAVASQFGGGGNVQVLYNAVELTPVPARSGGLPRHPVIGYAGRLDSGKGLRTFADSFLCLRRRYPNLQLLVAGEGPEASWMKALPITLLPFQSNMRPFWKAVDIAVQPSTEPDSFPRAVIEAMAHGKPVVGSRIGGIPEEIEDGVNGWLVPPGDTRALVRAIESLLLLPDLGAAMGRQGRARAERFFSIGTQMRLLVELYESRLQTGVSRGRAA